MLYEVTIEMRALVEAPNEREAERVAQRHAWEMDAELQAATIQVWPLRALGPYKGTLPWGGDGVATADALLAAQAAESSR